MKGTLRKSDLECEWKVEKTAHETWRARCEDDCFVRHKHELEPREKKFTCAEVRKWAWDWLVFTPPVAYKGNRHCLLAKKTFIWDEII